MRQRTLRASPRDDVRGFTLVEIILAMSTLAVVVLLATAALRVGLRAWEAGQRRVDLQQEGRALVELVSEALTGAYPYQERRAGRNQPAPLLSEALTRAAQGRLGQNPKPVVLFEGEAEEVRFVTSAPPLVLDAPAAPFHAVVLGRKGSEALRLAERLVPADEPFAPGPERVLSRSVTRFNLAYRDESGAWQARWDGRDAGGLPTAVRFELVIGGATRAAPAVVVQLPLGKRSQ